MEFSDLILPQIQNLFKASIISWK